MLTLPSDSDRPWVRSRPDCLSVRVEAKQSGQLRTQGRSLALAVL